MRTDRIYKVNELYMTQYKKALFLFQRDLRTQDNTALNLALEEAEEVVPLFVFNPKQCERNPFKSENAVQFMIESLRSLDSEVKLAGGTLNCIYGSPADIVGDLLKRHGFDAVYFNYDITPYARKRRDEIDAVCNRAGVDLVMAQDYYLTDPGVVETTSGKNYTKFTPYMRKVTEMIRTGAVTVDKPKTVSDAAFSSKRLPGTITLTDAMRRFGGVGSPDRLVSGGREEALKRMRHLPSSVRDYESTRNDLEDETTQMSAYIKFGCVSIREVYYSFRETLPKKASESLIRQLIWRDFYAQVLYFDPESLNRAMKPAYRKITWPSGTTSLLKAWKTGKTGFPIVDAGMREMAATGYMHNRARLIVGSFLPKTLLINWQEGEKFFAQSLTDYDPASNNGNWQWVAGTGTDSQPYFRILNPFLQSAKYDPEATYIKKWVPELSDVPAKDIHNWGEKHSNYSISYPSPVVDYSSQKEKALKLYASAVSD